MLGGEGGGGPKIKEGATLDPTYKGANYWVLRRSGGSFGRSYPKSSEPSTTKTKSSSWNSQPANRTAKSINAKLIMALSKELGNTFYRDYTGIIFPYSLLKAK